MILHKKCLIKFSINEEEGYFFNILVSMEVRFMGVLIIHPTFTSFIFYRIHVIYSKNHHKIILI